MPQTITLTFCKEKKGFYLVIRKQGESNGLRAKVQNLRNPNFECWDKEKQLFMEASTDAIHNNNVLAEMRGKYLTVLETCHPSSPAALKRMVLTGELVKASDVLTLGQFLKDEVERMKEEKRKKPTNTWSNYIKLLHKLEKEGRIIDVPLSEVNNRHFKQFGQFILAHPDEQGRTNYVDLMKRFKAAITRANKRELIKHTLTYSYMDDAPTTYQEPRQALTLKEYRRFVSVDLSQVPQSGCKPMFYQELYRDFCIFLYEMKMRPVDVLKLRRKNLVKLGENQVLCVRYIAKKKKNYTASRYIENKVTPTAMQLIDKYAGASKRGYIFPFSMNEYAWDFDNPESFNRWYLRKNSQLQLINVWLKKVFKLLQVKQTVTLYTFRHSALTHEVERKNKDIATIAKEAGTSINMIDKHYFNYAATL